MKHKETSKKKSKSINEPKCKQVVSIKKKQNKKQNNQLNELKMEKNYSLLLLHMVFRVRLLIDIEIKLNFKTSSAVHQMRPTENA